MTENQLKMIVKLIMEKKNEELTPEELEKKRKESEKEAEELRKARKERKESESEKARKKEIEYSTTASLSRLGKEWQDATDDVRSIDSLYA